MWTSLTKWTLETCTFYDLIFEWVLLTEQAIHEDWAAVFACLVIRACQPLYQKVVLGACAAGYWIKIAAYLENRSRSGEFLYYYYYTVYNPECDDQQRDYINVSMWVCRCMDPDPLWTVSTFNRHDGRYYDLNRPDPIYGSGTDRRQRNCAKFINAVAEMRNRVYFKISMNGMRKSIRTLHYLYT